VVEDTQNFPSRKNKVIPIENLEPYIRYITGLAVVRAASTKFILSQTDTENIATSVAEQLTNLPDFYNVHGTTIGQDNDSSIILLDIITQLIGLSVTIKLLLQLEVSTAEFSHIKREVVNRTVLLTRLILQARADDPPRIPLEKYAAYAAAICLAEFIAFDQNSKTDFVKATTNQNYERGFPDKVRPLIVQNIRTINLLIESIEKDVGQTERVTNCIKLSKRSKQQGNGKGKGRGQGKHGKSKGRANSW
jgi:hypothetical protein